MRINLVLAVFLLAAQVAAQDTDTTAPVDAPAPPPPSTPAATEPSPVISEPPPRFVPREEISPDRVISFPADI